MHEVKKQYFFMPPTLEKLKGHIALGLSVRPSVHPSVRQLQNLLRYSFEISFMDHKKDTYFLDYLPLWRYAPFKGS